MNGSRLTARLTASLVFGWVVLWGVHAFKSDYLSLATSVQDDAYYYLLPAWNFSRLGWFTFDGETSSYGFQPLWELALTIVAAVSHSREYFLRLTLLLGSVLYAATALGAGRAAGSICGTDARKKRALAAIVAGSTLLLNVPVQLSNLTGMENALYGALLVAFVNLHLERRLHQRPWFPISCGVVAGLILLTRVTPMSIAIVAVQPLMLRGRDRRLSYAGKYVLAAIGVLLPWMAYAQITFGSLLPFSDRLNAQTAWAMFASDNRPAVSRFAHVIGDYVLSCGRFASGLESKFWPSAHEYDFVGPVLVPLFAACGFIWASVTRRKGAHEDGAIIAPERYLLVLFCTVMIATVAIPVALSTDPADLYYRRWYVVELPILAAILAGVGADAIFGLVKQMSPRVSKTVAIGVVGAWIVLGGWQAAATARPATYKDEGTWQQVTLRAAAWSNRELALTRSDRVGAFSAGLLGWFSNGTVINLDGLANDDVARAILKSASIEEYCTGRRIRWYVDAVDPAELFGQYRVRATFPNASPEYPKYYVAEILHHEELGR